MLHILFVLYKEIWREKLKKFFFQQVVQYKPGVGSSDIKNVPRTKVGTRLNPHIEVSQN